ncbi:hypothetical protein [Actinacidiphila acidipaludis]|uniref:Uncharacterized protein n=1 Tax=Actinacidiphila acidipaludis TaxID=2873382 RepID=A0ABS7QI08_9ACTN|nr:hypothetical protein [Streptomyces acidipaludis]MBY8882319.1 hypothetical protein [Streptomyces acidipaludis]
MLTRSRHDSGLLPRRQLRARAARGSDPDLTPGTAAGPDLTPGTAAGAGSEPAHAGGRVPTPAMRPPEHPSHGRRRANAYDRYSLVLQLIQVFPVVSAFLVAMIADSLLAFALAGAALAAATGLVVWAERTGRPYGLTASGTAPPGDGRIERRILLGAPGRPPGALADPADAPDGDPAAQDDTVSLLISLHHGTTTEHVILHVALPHPRGERPTPE